MRRRLCPALALCLLAALAGCSRAPAPVSFIADGRPEHLSDWHLLNVSGGRLAPNAGVLPYDLVTPLFSVASIATGAKCPSPMLSSAAESLIWAST